MEVERILCHFQKVLIFQWFELFFWRAERQSIAALLTPVLAI
ncbi:hypothetical protein OH686_20830 [Pseudomonas sp. SO81]|nr:hypothetical protein OH686_20830 [Pseudomonas sp. SO81]